MDTFAHLELENKMKTLSIAALILALAVPGIAQAATDGTLGPTSTGTFSASITLNSPAGTNVQVLGLNDFNFGQVNGQITTSTSIPAQSDAFCLTRNNAGNVLVTVSQVGVANATPFSLSDGNGRTLGLGITINNPSGSGFGFNSGTTVALQQSGATCTASTTDLSIAHKLTLAPAALISQNAGANYGVFSGSFQITIAPQ